MVCNSSDFDAFLNRRPMCSMIVVYGPVGCPACTASTIAVFSSFKFWRSLPQSQSFKNPHKWKSRRLQSGLFALHGWRLLRLMHLVPKWFEIHCSTSLDTWGAAWVNMMIDCYCTYWFFHAVFITVCVLNSLLVSGRRKWCIIIHQNCSSWRTISQEGNCT